MSKNLFLLCTGKDESSFLNTELKYLSQKFDKIYILPYGQEHDVHLPANGKILQIPKGISEDISYPKLVSLLIRYVKHTKKRGRSIRLAFSYLKQLQMKSEECLPVILSKMKKGDLIYSYWWDDWAMVYSLMKNRLPKHTFISRAHGFDLYEERITNRPNFKPLFTKSTDAVFCISNDGKEYLRERYPDLKVEVSRLGTPTHEDLNQETDTIRVVSCSALVPVKRIDRIINALNTYQGEKRVEWVHFGDGKEGERLKNMCDFSNEKITFSFMGNVKNKIIHKFYRERAVSLFINASESEGIPMAIMEAISYGIPVLAPNVGGIKEIVKPEIGYLVDEESYESELIRLLSSEEFRKFDRQKIKTFWLNNFSEANFEKFADEIYSIA